MAHSQPRLPIHTEDGHHFELIQISGSAPDCRFLMIPAMGITARQYIPFAKALAEHNVEVFIHEWRGFGSSNQRAKRQCDWGYATLLSDIEASVAAIKIHATEESAPVIIAGHSLGSQLALLALAMHPESFNGYVCIAGGSPYFHVFPWPMSWALKGLFTGMPAIAKLVGHYPGYRLGFAGREARGVMVDWAQSGKTGQYCPANFSKDMETALKNVRAPLLGIRMADDWFVPPDSLTYLLDKCPKAPSCQAVVTRSNPKLKVDHYHWMTNASETVSIIDRWIKQTVFEHS